MSTTFTVFVCSTFSDLSAERDGVLDAIRRLKLQHDSMEFFGARSQQPIETCLQEVRTSDVLVVIVGHRYGSLVPDLGISYSEAEYVEGVHLNKPCLVYMRDEDVPVLPRHIERDPVKLKLLEEWKATLQSRHTVATFREGSDLAVQVAADLARTAQDLEEIAKARSAERTPSQATLLDDVKHELSAAVDQGISEASLLSAVRSAIANLLLTSQKRESTVFFSYVRHDADIVTSVAKGLSASGISVWIDQDIQPGSNWLEEIERELSKATFIAIFISRHSASSPWARKEINVAMHRQMSGEGGAILLPVILEDADVPPLLRQYQWIDMRDGNVKAGVRKLMEAVHHWSSVKSR